MQAVANQPQIDVHDRRAACYVGDLHVSGMGFFLRMLERNGRSHARPRELTGAEDEGLETRLACPSS